MTPPFPSPFDAQGPSPRAEAAAHALMAELRASGFGRGEGGKMFGVLVARGPDGERVVLRAFSGMLEGKWLHDGFCGPLFDDARRAAVEGPGEAVVKALWARAEAFAHSGELEAARQALASARGQHEEAHRALRTRHTQRRAERHRLREATRGLTAEAAHALDQQSRADKAERRRFDAAAAAVLAPLQRTVHRLLRRERALERLRHFVCRRVMQDIQDSYEVPNARGERRPLRSLYPGGAPPSGAGDCAAPKLLATAYARRLHPVALAEFWWGPPPSTGGRVEGAFYPACKDKCGPLLPFMLEGLEVSSQRVFTPATAAARAGLAPDLDVVFEDAWLVVLHKPEGLLSVPGKGASLIDSVQTRLRQRFPEAEGPLLAHRLDLDTSGLLVAAKDLATYRALQRQFLRREVHKRYVAVLEGPVARDGGTISLPLRVDLNDRPRQIVDTVHGRHAETRWQVLSRSNKRTRVALHPVTGRTHQLRVHAAHPEGLGAPIVGDRLYGFEAERLLLHAEALAFIHPATTKPVSFTALAPF